MAYRNMRTKNLIIGSMGAIKPRFVVDQVAFLGRFEEPVMACRNMRTKKPDYKRAQLLIQGLWWIVEI